MAIRGDFSQRRVDDPRFPVLVPVTIETVGAAGLPQQGQAVNLSRGGLGLQFFGALDPGIPVRVTLHLHSQSALMCMGRVAWADRAFLAGQASAGIAFKDKLSGDFVTHLASEEFPPSAEKTRFPAATH